MSVSRPPDLVQGTLDLPILKILALEPQNGWAISRRLEQVSNNRRAKFYSLTRAGRSRAAAARAIARPIPRTC